MKISRPMGGIAKTGLPPTPEPGPDLAAEAKRQKEEAERKARGQLWALKARAAWFSELVYHHHEDLTELCALKHMEQFECFADGSGSSAVFAFIFEERAWLVFRGTNDLNDWARNISFLPFWHFGFQLCYRDLPNGLHEWVERVAAEGHRFCVTGHSLGAAMATLAAEKLALDKRPIEILCTFGSPRVFPPRRADAFEELPANWPGKPDVRLKNVTFRIVDKYEAVSHVPFALFGFRHVGLQEEYGRLELPAVTREAVAAEAFRSDLATAFKETMKGALIAPYVLALITFVKAVYRVFMVKSAHKMRGYADNVDQLQALRIAHDQPHSRLSKGRFRLVSLIPFIILGALLWLMGWLIGPSLVQLARATGRIFWEAPWATLLAFAVLGVVTFCIEFAKLRRARREAWPIGNVHPIPPPEWVKPSFKGAGEGL